MSTTAARFSPFSTGGPQSPSPVPLTANVGRTDQPQWLEGYRQHGKLILEQMKVSELKAILRSYHLHVSGLKEDLIHRIEEYLQRKGEHAPSSPSTFGDFEINTDQQHQRSETAQSPTAHRTHRSNQLRYLMVARISGQTPRCTRTLSARGNISWTSFLSHCLAAFDFDFDHLYRIYLPDGRVLVHPMCLDMIDPDPAHPSNKVLFPNNNQTSESYFSGYESDNEDEGEDDDFLHPNDNSFGDNEEDSLGRVRRVLNANLVTLEGSRLNMGDKVEVLYDFGDEWRFMILVQDIHEEQPFTVHNISLVSQVGRAPPQYGETDDEEMEDAEEVL